MLFLNTILIFGSKGFHYGEVQTSSYDAPSNLLEKPPITILNFKSFYKLSTITSDSWIPSFLIFKSMVTHLTTLENEHNLLSNQKPCNSTYFLTNFLTIIVNFYLCYPSTNRLTKYPTLKSTYFTYKFQLCKFNTLNIWPNDIKVTKYFTALQYVR